MAKDAVKGTLDIVVNLSHSEINLVFLKGGGLITEKSEGQEAHR
jgi:hypothetical protein